MSITEQDNSQPSHISSDKDVPIQ
jgi:hypothetical protein